MDIVEPLRQLLEAVNQIRQDLDFWSYPGRFIASNLSLVMGTLQAFVFQTGDPFNPGHDFVQVQPIRQFLPLTRAAADIGLTAATGWGFYRIMWAHGRNTHTLRNLLPRACLAVVLINFSPTLVQAAIEACNALSQAVLAASPGDHVKVLQTWFTDTTSIGLYAVTLLALFGSYAVLALAYVVRFALLVILAILAPVAALLFILPETQRYAREWGHLFIGALLMQPLQLLVIQIGFALDLSFEATTVFPLRHLFALAAIYIAFKVPGALNSASRAGTKAYSFAKRESTHAYHAAFKALARV
jgi:hypothetical protein